MTEMMSLPVPIIAALIGALSATLVALLTNLAFTRRQHVRVQRVALLQRQLSEAYAPLMYSLASIASLDSTPEARKAAWPRIREIVARHAYLISPSLQGELMRLAVSDDAEAGDRAYELCHQEFDLLTDAYYRNHFRPISPQAHLRYPWLARHLRRPLRRSHRNTS
jgi:hypothetical protein